MRKIICLAAMLSASVASASIYTGVSGGWFTNRDMDGWGAGAHVGCDFAEKSASLHQGVELEVWGIHNEDAHNQQAAHLDGPLKGWKLHNKRTVKLNQMPVMANYRLWGKFAPNMPFSWYAGAGVGFQWARSKDRSVDTLKDNTGATVSAHDTHEILGGSTTYYKKRDQIRFTGQLFAGLGIEITEALVATAGTRVFMTNANKWADGRDIAPATVHTGPFQVGVEAGLNYAF